MRTAVRPDGRCGLMHLPLPDERGINGAPSVASDVLAAAQRMAELAVVAARNLVAAHELSRREANGIAVEVETVRCSLEMLALKPKNSAAAANVAEVLPKLDEVISLHLWALSAPSAEQWRDCRALLLRASVGARGWSGRWRQARPLHVDDARDLASVRDSLPAALRAAAEQARERRLQVEDGAKHAEPNHVR